MYQGKFIDDNLTPHILKDVSISAPWNSKGVSRAACGGASVDNPKGVNIIVCVVA